MHLRPRARIHLNNIAENWRTLNAFQRTGVTGAVVKADAYGHGAEQVGQALCDAGCDHFFVAHCHEGVSLRRAIASNPVIYVLNGPAPYEEPLYRENALTPVINSAAQFKTLVTWLESGGRFRNGYALHFDSGMNRLGLPISDAAHLSEAAKQHPPALIMSHLACSEEPTNAMNSFQLEHFSQAAAHFPTIPTSLSNSGGIWLGSDYHQALTRPGIALYGGGYPPDGTSLLPGLTLEAPILQVRVAEAGETVGYGASHRLNKPTPLATVAIGYGDGFPRSASNKGYVTIDAKRCPIVGRVSMDLVTVDISAAADLARPGVYAQFIGPDVPLEDQAVLAGTIGYELTTGLLPRVTRIYED